MEKIKKILVTIFITLISSSSLKSMELLEQKEPEVNSCQIEIETSENEKLLNPWCAFAQVIKHQESEPNISSSSTSPSQDPKLNTTNIQLLQQTFLGIAKQIEEHCIISTLKNQADFKKKLTSNKPKAISYSILPKINTVLNQIKKSEIKECDAGFANWLDDIPLDFRKLIDKEIIAAANKYLLRNQKERIYFFKSLPDDSLIKTALCFTYYFNPKRTNPFIDNPHKFSQDLTSRSYLTSASPLYLEEEIKTLIKSRQLDQIFIATYYCFREMPGRLVLINLFPEFYQFNRYKINGFPEKLEQFLKNILELIEPYFGIPITSLNLSCNLLNNLPSSVFLMDHLQELYLHKNKIMVLLKEIGHLKNLQILDLEDNNLQKIPNELLKLPKLKKINLRKNPSLVYDLRSQEIIKELKAKGIKVKY